MQSWQERAKLLRLGEKRKVVHCGTDPSAYISNGVDRVRLHCFRCGANEYEKHEGLSLADVLAMRRAEDAAVGSRSGPVGIPYKEAPVHALLWSLKSGLSPEVATDRYGFTYSETLDRIVVPVLNNGVDTGLWTARAASGQRPKYIMPKGASGGLWYDTRPSSGEIVVVEDILSAIKISRAGYASVAVLGTSIPWELGRLCDNRQVIGWFDPDKAGRQGYVKLRKALAPHGISPFRVTSERDPKLHQRHEIQSILKGVL